MADMQPSEIARETLRQLAMRRIPPTPDNYLTLYNEISGTKVDEIFPSKTLKQLLTRLPRNNAEQTRLARLLETSVAEGSWDSFQSALSEIFVRGGAEPPAWGSLLKEMLVQLEARTAGLTPAKKRESIEHILRASPAPDILFQRLQNVVRTWGQTPLNESGPANTDTTPLPSETAINATAAAAGESTSTRELRDLIAKLLEDSIGSLLQDSPELVQESSKLAIGIRAASTSRQLAEVSAQLKKFSYRLNFVAEDQAELKNALHSLVQLIIQNIGELVIDDQWLHGQIATVSELMAKPLDLRTLDDAERRFKDVIYKQSALKKSLDDANERLKQMLATFVDRLGDFSSTTSGYHDKIEQYAGQISKSKDVTELSGVLEEVMRETRLVQMNAARSRDELSEMRRRVQDAENEVKRLQDELSQASEMVRMDPLTGALNRKGMDEAVAREVARTRRHDSMLSVALLDIDNFKKINDHLGHQAGDAALVHLATVTRETIRPQDTLARYGGEEFVILLPDTNLDDAVKAMERVQRELTRRFFLHENNKLLITFSAGVAELTDDEEPGLAIKRADEAMYLAKRAGKNRVMAA
ncbi:MAG TPA: diguanylate cyclase [Rhodocyclaceae bacterium]|jgi:diguanylate cyclase|nr:diguanylate cyclase [Rhodocyclaceae bacterium]